MKTLAPIFLSLALTVSPIAEASDPWTPEEVHYAQAYGTLLAIDLLQTRWIATHPTERKESNPVLGPYPSIGRVNGYFGVVALGSLWLADVSPSEYRLPLLKGLTALEIVVTSRNAKLGIGFQF